MKDYFLRIRKLVDQRLGEFQGEHGLDHISQSYRRYGVHKEGEKFVYREWAP